jgi:TolB-like protein/Tfp pilus assembly protein PilF
MSLYRELKRRNVIRVAIAYLALAWLVTEVAGTLFPAFGIPDWGIRFLVIVFALGFVPALIISWAYEITPEGLKREKEVVRDASITHLTAKRLDVFTIGLIVVALAFLLADRFWLSPRHPEQIAAPAESVTDTVQTSEPESQYPPNSIAVLAFTDLSPAGDQEYFSDGISEELLNVLAKIPGLRVAARTSSFQFKGQNQDVIDIGQQLNVAFVLEGSVRKAGLQIRITAQLVDASNGFHLWSETYDRELANIFAVQDEISAAIVGALKEHLGLEVEAAPRVIAAANTEAHDAYMRGRYLVVQRTRATIEGAVSEFERAIALDPDYALAHAELALATLLQGLYSDLTNAESIARAAPYVERVIALDPTLAEAHAANGMLMWAQDNLDQTLTHFAHAIQINPNYSIVYTWMALLLNQRGRYEESFSMEETALRLDPLSIPAISNYVLGLSVRNRLDDADRELEKIASIYPARYASARGDLTSVGGKWANAVLGGLDALRTDPESVYDRQGLTRGFASIGLEQEALAISQTIRPVVLRMLGRPGDAVTTAEVRLFEDPTVVFVRHDLGLALAAAGDYTRARPILEEVWQWSGGLVTRYGEFSVNSAAAMIAIRRGAGEEAEVDELLAAIRDNVRRYREAGITGGDWNTNADYEEGLAAYLEGERERGLALIAKGAEDGIFILQREAYLQTLYDDPGFAPIIARQEARQARERNRFLSIVCIDNPYEEVWQPAEGTCERFAAEGGN